MPIRGHQARVSVGPASSAPVRPTQNEKLRKKIEAIALGKTVAAIDYTDLHFLVFTFSDGAKLQLYAGELKETDTPD